MSMLSEKFNDYLKPTDLLIKIIWISEFLTMGIYVFIAHVAGRSPENTMAPELNMRLVCLFTLLGVAVTISSIIFHALFLSPRAVAKFADGKMHPWMWTVICLDDVAGSYAACSEQLASLPAEERIFYIYSRAALRLFLFFYAYMNTCAIFGMVLAIITRKPELCYPFIGCSAVLMLFYFPNLVKLIENAKTIEEYNAD
ncbi:MAG TPA: hypothetical protein DET40_02400 [Lentisphaeria bacterium]|nr:MAG: hypothetical protein A2X45_20505 [Lentisphaerae bacterium GWF2_50_93]HCE42383.1 hypothetical protein [Lentisphaeria bacterium]